jgi:hypothetical protein
LTLSSYFIIKIRIKRWRVRSRTFILILTAPPLFYLYLIKIKIREGSFAQEKGGAIFYLKLKREGGSFLPP